MLVVLVLLTMFAVVAVAFVFFSEQEKMQSIHFQQAENKDRPDPDLLLGFALNRLIFDTNDGGSALFGHGLLRNVYGQSGNLPFNGTGKLHYTPVAGPLAGLDHYYLLNYSAGISDGPAQLGSFNPPYTFPDHNAPWLGAVASEFRYPVDHDGDGVGPGKTPRILSDPVPNVVTARSWVRVNQFLVSHQSLGLKPVFFNPYAPENYGFWTRQDWQNPRPSDLSPEWTVVPLTDAQKRAMVLRPIPWDRTKCARDADDKLLFPSPEDFGGDVKNLPPGTRVLVGYDYSVQYDPKPIFANNDSYWMDLNYPVQVGPDGRRYKPLFAPIIIDLDGKFNLNEHFNQGHLAATGGSGFGLGPHEIAPPRADATAPEYAALRAELAQLLLGSNRGTGTAQHTEAGRHTGLIHGKDADGNPLPESPGGGIPGGPGDKVDTDFDRRVNQFTGAFLITGARSGVGGPIYSRVDMSGRNFIPLSLPPALSVYDTTTKLWNFDHFPFYSPTYDNARAGAWALHPLLHSFFTPRHDRNLPAAGLEALLRSGDTNTDAQSSAISRLCPTAFSAGGLTNKLLWQVTTHSLDRAAGGRSPWFRPPTTTGHYLGSDDSSETRRHFGVYPTGQRIPVGGDLNPTNAGEFGANSNQGSDLQLLTDRQTYPGRRLDLFNRPFLTTYPAADGTGRISLAPADRDQYRAAVIERRTRAAEIFLLLVELTGARVPQTGQSDPKVGTPEYESLRWLAQLAVNIVDYMDPDDFMTPFPWAKAFGSSADTWRTQTPQQPPQPAPNELQKLGIGMPGGPGGGGGGGGLDLNSEYVFGTELPRVVINEIYSNFIITGNGAQLTYKLWVELLNPSHRDDPLTDGGHVALQFEGGAKTGIYKLIVGPPNPFIRHSANVRGDSPWYLTAPTAGRPVVIGDDPNEFQSEFDKARIEGSGTRTGSGSKYRPNEPGAPATETAYEAGFYVIGPKPPNLEVGNMPPSTLESLDLIFVQLTGIDQLGVLPDEIEKQLTQIVGNQRALPTVLLQRLACTRLDPDNNPASDFYNPYVTIDYVENIRPEHIVDPNTANVANLQGGSTPKSKEKTKSVGRNQPYAAHQSQRKDQRPDTDTNRPQTEKLDEYTDQPQHTFFRHNGIEPEKNIDHGYPNPRAVRKVEPEVPGEDPIVRQTLKLPFDWLVHLDRPLTSPMELLHVSGYKPHELTQQFQQFITDGSVRANHIVGPSAPPRLPTDKARYLPRAGTGANGKNWQLWPGHVILVTDDNAERSNPEAVMVTEVDLSAHKFDATFNKNRTAFWYYVQQFNHTAPWFNPDARLYRVFEFLESMPLGQFTTLLNGPQTVLPSGSDVACAPASMSGIYPGLIVSLAHGSVEVRGVVKAVNLASSPPEFVASFVNSGTTNVTFPSGAAILLHERRRSGKININTVWDPEIFMGLTDMPNAPVPPYASVDAFREQSLLAYHRLVASRNGPSWMRLPTYSPGVAGPAPVMGHPDSKPFWPFTVGPQPAASTQFSNGTTGIEQTWLRPYTKLTAGANPNLAHYYKPLLLEMYDPDAETGKPADHAYHRNWLLSKIANNTTTRSNVFAVWMTVGYFEVDDQGRLGAEIGRADGRHKRHRMFSIVDRSVIDAYFAPQGAINPYLGLDPRRDYTSTISGTAVLAAAVAQSVAPAAMNGVVPGTILTIDRGKLNEERVVVTAADYAANPPTFSAVFTKPHDIGFTIEGGTASTVLHWSIIE